MAVASGTHKFTGIGVTLSGNLGVGIGAQQSAVAQSLKPKDPMRFLAFLSFLIMVPITFIINGSFGIQLLDSTFGFLFLYLLTFLAVGLIYNAIRGKELDQHNDLYHRGLFCHLCGTSWLP